MPRSVYLNLFVLSLIWGASFFFIKVLLETFEPWTIVMLRSTFGLVVLFALMFIKREWNNLKKLPWVPLMFTGFLNTAVPWGLIAMSETRLTSSMTSVLNATTPLWTLLVGLLFFGAKSSKSQWLGIGIGFLGMLILLDLNPVSIISVDLLGFVGMISATMCYAVSTQLAKKYLTGTSSYQISFFTLLFSTILSGGIALMTEEIHWRAVIDPDILWPLCGLGMLGSGVAYVFYYYLIKAGGPEFASMVTYLVPATAILWGFALLHEPIHWNLLIGLACILGGVFFASRSAKTAGPITPKKAASM